jgi:hypothetical protein
MTTSNNKFNNYRQNKSQKETANSLIYPIDAFPEEIQHLINQMMDKLDAPPSFVGSTLLTTFSTAIGTSIHVKTALGPTHLSIWSCLVGISSSGKSIASNELFKPIYEIQKDLDTQREDQELRMNEDDKERAKIKQVMYSEGNVPTLIKELLKPNPKGILFDTDELLVWINGLNAYGKGDGGSDEQMWIRIWDSREIRKVLSGNKIFKVDKPFVNIFGGIQPALLYKLYHNDRDYSGFCYRILFAYPESNKIALPNLKQSIESSLFTPYANAIKRLYHDLTEDSNIGIKLTSNALDIYEGWIVEKTHETNALKNQYELEHTAGIFGKMKIYTLRIAGILTVMNASYKGLKIDNTLTIDAECMLAAIKLANFYFAAALKSLIAARENQFAPPIVIQMANLHKKGLNNQEVGDKLYPTLNKDARRKRVSRDFRKFYEKYPAIFGSKAK